MQVTNQAAPKTAETSQSALTVPLQNSTKMAFTTMPNLKGQTEQNATAKSRLSFLPLWSPTSRSIPSKTDVLKMTGTDGSCRLRNWVINASLLEMTCS